MNTSTIARLVLVCAAGLVAATGVQAKGSSMGVGLTIVASCAVSSENVYRAAASNVATATNSKATMTAACANETSSYTVSMSAGAKVDSAAVSSDASRAADAGYVTVTLTY